MLLLRRASAPLNSLPLVLALLALPGLGRAQEIRGTAPSEPRPALHEQLARVDSIFFDALFARCDAERANTLLAADVEFYDDRTGLSVGDDLRADFRRLTENCPADNGVRRILLPGSVEVHPIEGFGAMQLGEHHFVERGASTSTVAKFFHVWKRVDDGWRLARIVSLHETLDAERAAERRR